MARYLYSELAGLVQARLNCIERGNTEWKLKHEDAIELLCKEHMPSGSGFDNGTSIDFDKSTGDKLVFTTAFHHIDEAGGYDGWTEHVVVVTQSLAHQFYLRISGRNRNDIKLYMGDCFRHDLSMEVTR